MTRYRNEVEDPALSIALTEGQRPRGGVGRSVRRMVANIAHGYAVDFFGLDEFEPANRWPPPRRRLIRRPVTEAEEQCAHHGVGEP